MVDLSKLLEANPKDIMKLKSIRGKSHWNVRRKIGAIFIDFLMRKTKDIGSPIKIKKLNNFRKEEMFYHKTKLSKRLIVKVIQFVKGWYLSDRFLIAGALLEVSSCATLKKVTKVQLARAFKSILILWVVNHGALYYQFIVLWRATLANWDLQTS